jgi:hypothetical protein
VSRYAARIRALEHKLRPGECRVCMGRAWDMVRVEGDDPVPSAPLCEACGEPRRQFIIHFSDDVDDELARSQQPAAEPFSPRAPAAESVPPAEGVEPRAESRSKPRTRRRQYSGQG